VFLIDFKEDEVVAALLCTEVLEVAAVAATAGLLDTTVDPCCTGWAVSAITAFSAADLEYVVGVEVLEEDDELVACNCCTILEFPIDPICEAACFPLFLDTLWTWELLGACELADAELPGRLV